LFQIAIGEDTTMKTLAGIFGLTAALLGTPVLAADMAVKTPPPTPQPAFSWTGFYVGGNLGYGWGRSSNQVTFVDPLFAGTIAQSRQNGLDRVIAGGQFGYNWQFSPHAVLGLETDWQSSNKGASGTTVSSIILPGLPPDHETATTSYGSKISWFGTVRGRVGYAFDSLLIYGTAGLAYGKVSVSGTVTDAANFTGVGGPAFIATTPFSISAIKTGWTAGAGIEQALSINWTWKVEYLYVDLGTISGFFLAPNPFFTDNLTAQNRFSDSILRVGLNYRFN
jgi:outer membrane immunogenic protein